MKLSVLVPTMGERPNELRRLLQSIIDQNYSDCEVLIVSQDHFKETQNIIDSFNFNKIKHITINEKGLSHARNVGLKYCSGEIVLLSDDDCWYAKNAFADIEEGFLKSKADILLTQIYDKTNEKLYKNYPDDSGYITNKIQLMSKSSIEIAFKQNNISYCQFDERFGLGSKFVCGEEVDFLLNNLGINNIFYMAKVTVYHPRKSMHDTSDQIIAKGAIYAKDYNLFWSYVVLLKDFFLRHENNFSLFFKGYHELKKEEA